MELRVWLCLALGCMGVTAKYLPTPELVEDSLMPFDNSQVSHRMVRSIEGSGDDDLTPIKPISSGVDKYMERLEAHKDTIDLNEDEGSGAAPKYDHDLDSIPRVAAIREFSEEEDMSVLKELNEPEGLPKEDDNRQGNSLNVLASEDRPKTPPDEEHNQVLDPVFEGSGEPDAEIIDVKNVTMLEEVKNREVTELFNRESKELETTDAATTEISENGARVLSESEDENRSEIPPTTEEITRKDLLQEVDSEIPQIDEASTTVAIVPSESTLTADEEETVSPDPPVEPQLETTVSSEDVNSVPEISATDSPQPILHDSEEPETTTGAEPGQATKITSEEAVPAIELTTISQETSDSAQEEQTNSPSTKAAEISTEQNIFTFSSTPNDVEIIRARGVVQLASANEENIAVGNPVGDEQVAESSIPKSLSTSIIIGVLVVAFIALIVFVTFRNRRKRQVRRIENSSEPDTEKALLSNGKYKPDSDDVKNNEITPLVINKFEKSPNFSSQKNLNTLANDKNIEKDNVLKQAIIEDEVEEAKKAIEEGKGSLLNAKTPDEETKTPEKVVVRTHIDLDSIPRKPVLVTKNDGKTYESVPNGESKT